MPKEKVDTLQHFTFCTIGNINLNTHTNQIKSVNHKRCEKSLTDIYRYSFLKNQLHHNMVVLNHFYNILLIIKIKMFKVCTVTLLKLDSIDFACNYHFTNRTVN